VKVCDILKKQGCIEEEHIEKALKIQAGSAKPIGEILLEMGAVKDDELEGALTLQSDLDSEHLSDKAAFLETIDPFCGLAAETLAGICDTMEWKKFDPGENIQKEGLRGECFYIVKDGLAKIFMEKDHEEKIIGFLGEGDFCGVTALLSDGINPSTVIAIEQTLCLVQDKDAFAEMVRSYPRFAAYFNELIIRQSKRVFTRLLTTGTGIISQTEPFLYTKRVKDLISPNQLFLPPADTLEEAAAKLIGREIRTAVVVDEDGRVLGTLGLEELVEASLLRREDRGQAVRSIVRKDAAVIDGENYFFDALHQMMKQGRESLIVMDSGRLSGVLTSLDLLKFRGRETLSLIRSIEEARSTGELNSLRQDVEGVLRALVSDNALPSHACKIISELNDRIVKRAIRLSEETLGIPPVPYAWLGLGSEGRREQTLLTDQDNALVFDPPAAGRDPETIQGYFQSLADMVVNNLNQCGFPLCKGNIMATNPRYFGSLASWKDKTKHWINVNTEKGEDLIDIYTFLDFRAVYGSESLEEALRSHVMNEFERNPAALRLLAQPIVDIPVPLGFFKNFVVEKNGKYKNTVNIKVNGLLPLTTCVKLLAFYAGVAEANTLERLQRLAEKGVIPVDRSEFIAQAFETFLGLKIQNNLLNLDEGRDFSNNVNPSDMNTRQKQLLKDSFLAVSEMQKITKDVLKMM
jgi:CBS domain-containing protein